MHAFLYIRFFLIIAGFLILCHGEACVDRLPDCADYTLNSCKPPYIAWAHINCPAFCGFCRKNCVDKLSDCNEYGRAACLPLYETWARKNCADYCGYCGAGSKCLYSPWINLAPCSKTCGGGFVVQVRTFTFVSNDTLMAKDCNEDLVRNKSCNNNICTTSSPGKVTVHDLINSAVLNGAVGAVGAVGAINSYLNKQPNLVSAGGKTGLATGSGETGLVAGSGETGLVAGGSEAVLGTGSGDALLTIGKMPISAGGEAAAISSGTGGAASVIGAGETAAVVAGEGAAAAAGETAALAIGETAALAAGETAVAVGATLGETLLSFLPELFLFFGKRSAVDETFTSESIVEMLQNINLKQKK